jgi:hypothetical protein
MYVRHIPEHPGVGGRLGRHVRHDPRSLNYRYPARSTGTLKSVRHTRRIPVLDQGDLGACTGFAAEGCVGTGALYDAIPMTVPARPAAGNADRDADQARGLYSVATGQDDFPGSWPPVDTGSDGLSVAKACVNAGLITGYQHATSLEAALAALEAQAVITGVNWYDSFDEPASTGLIKITRRASVRGGHEFELEELDVENRLVWFTNSWTAQWGVDGRACLGWDDFGRLLSEQGDVTVFTPLTKPAPQPTPNPGNQDLAGCLGTILQSAQRALDILKGKTP